MSDQEQKLAILAGAVARNAGTVVSLPSAGMVHHFKSRFLGEEDGGMWVEADREAILQFKELIGSQQPLAVSFRGPAIRMGFAACALHFNPEFRFNATSTLPAVFISRVSDVKAIQRRNAYRVRVGADCGLSIRVWSITEQAHIKDRPTATQEIKAQITDISIGGLGVRFDLGEDKGKRLIPDQRLRVQLTTGEGEEILIEGRLRRTQKAVGVAPAVSGIVLKKLENDVEGRQQLALLTRIIGELHRQEVRRSRLGLAS